MKDVNNHLTVCSTAGNDLIKPTAATKPAAVRVVLKRGFTAAAADN
jgi:hypothetical protein